LSRIHYKQSEEGRNNRKAASYSIQKSQEGRPKVQMRILSRNVQSDMG
jgi:hypothetical protein